MTRDELSAAVIAHKAHMKRVALTGALAILSVFALTAASLRPLRDVLLTHFGKPQTTALLFLAIAWPFWVVPFPMWLAERRAMRRAGVNCQSCRRSMLKKWRHVLDTNLCPYCGSHVFTED